MKNQSSPLLSTLRKIGLGFVIISFVSLIVFFLVCSFTYSEGVRAGLLIKFSKRGYLFKTYEGELNIGGMQPPTSTVGANLIWAFSVKDEAVAAKLLEMEGKYVSLHYKGVIKNFWWQGDTKYFVDGVEEIKR